MTTEIKAFGDLILAVSLLDRCTIIHRCAEVDVPKGSNSIVRYSRWTITKELLEAALPVFNEVYSRDSSITEAYPDLRGKTFNVDDLMQCGSNYVQVFGAAPESMHIHATTIVAHVVQGKGILLSKDQYGDEWRDQAYEGDTIVIPAGAPHFFHGDPLIAYTGIEFGPVIDYQKHHQK